MCGAVLPQSLLSGLEWKAPDPGGLNNLWRVRLKILLHIPFDCIFASCPSYQLSLHRTISQNVIYRSVRWASTGKQLDGQPPKSREWWLCWPSQWDRGGMPVGVLKTDNARQCCAQLLNIFLEAQLTYLSLVTKLHIKSEGMVRYKNARFRAESVPGRNTSPRAHRRCRSAHLPDSVTCL